jgi:hypothetical protein
VNKMTYPEGMDCVWLASDRDGHVGAFITAGVAPIPVEALATTCLPIEDIESRICELPLVSQVQLLVLVKRPESYIDLATRGVFVYDWQDVHRTANRGLRVYEPVAVPTQPIAALSMPADLATLAASLRLTNVAFSARENVDIRAYLSCVEAV